MYRTKMPMGGATFTPRMKSRPKPSKNTDVFYNAIKKNVRTAFLCACLGKVLFPLYMMCAKFFEDRGYSERVFFCVGVTVIHSVLYFGMNGIFLFWDRNGIFEKYKLDRTETMGPTDALMRKTWAQAIVGQALIGPVTLYFLYPIFKHFGSPSFVSELPSFYTLLKNFWVAYFCNDFFFYWAHRTVHSKLLYKWIHKQHHEYKGTIGFAAEFAHPVEQIFANQGPTIIGCLVMGVHFHIFFTWLAVRLEQTYEGHSGYCFYGTWLHKIGLTNSEGAAYHDYHHTKNCGNFGNCWLDDVFGTQDAWLAMGGVEGYIAKKRSENALNYPHVRAALKRKERKLR